eukprot:2802540-Karenia_brevis.AAC.1
MEQTHKWNQPAAEAGVKQLKASKPYSRNAIFGNHSCFRNRMSEVVYADKRHEARYPEWNVLQEYSCNPTEPGGTMPDPEEVWRQAKTYLVPCVSIIFGRMAMTKIEIPLAPRLVARTWAPEDDQLLWNKADHLDINYMARLLAK